MFVSQTSHSDSSVPALSLFRQPQASTSFSMHSGPRTLFGSASNANGNFSSSLNPSSLGNANTLFGSTFSAPHNNSFFTNSPRVGLFSTSNLNPTTPSSIFSNSNSSNIFSSNSKPGPVGFPAQSSAGNLFQQTSIYSNSTGPGTPIPFRAVQSSDSVMKGGTQVNVQVRLECIPAMKEYENKSLEELRYEDYVAGRKGISNVGFLSQTSVQPGIFSTLSNNNPSAKGMFNYMNNPVHSNNQFSPQSSGLFTTKPQAPSLFSQVSQGTKPLSNNSNALFGSTSLTSNSSLFPQQIGNQFSTLMPSASHNSAYLNQSIQPANVFTSQPISNFFGSKPANGPLNNNVGFSFGQNFNTQLGKPVSLLSGQPSTHSTGLQSSSLNTQLVGFPPKPFDLSLPKTSAAFVLNNSLMIPSYQLNSIQGEHVRNSIINGSETPDNLERQLLILARIPFGDSQLFRDAKQTVENLGVEKRTNDISILSDKPTLNFRKTAPSGNIFKMKIQSTQLGNNIHDVQSSIFFHRLDNPPVSQHSLDSKLLVSRKLSVKNLELTNKKCHGTLNLDDSILDIPSIKTNIQDLHSSEHHNNLGESSPNIFQHQMVETSSTIPELETRPEVQNLNTSDLESSLIDDHHIQHVLLSLTRSDYSTVPSCRDIIDQVSHNFKLIVREFTIIRNGFGQIQFPGSTDITGLDLDLIVFIERREVTVYPIESNKPKYGFGLNKEAIVSLYEVWPIDKSTRQAIHDPVRILSSRYYEKVEKSTEKLGAQFIDYDIHYGIWKFKVEHFSKYKLLISDSSDGDEDNDEINTDIKLGTSLTKVITKPKTPCNTNGVIQSTDQSNWSNMFLPVNKSANFDLFKLTAENSSMRQLFFQSNFIASKDSSECNYISFPNLNPQPLDILKSYHKPVHYTSLIIADYNIPKPLIFKSLSIVLASDSIIHQRIRYTADSSCLINRSYRPCWGYNAVLSLSLPSSNRIFPKFSVILMRCSPFNNNYSSSISLLDNLVNTLLQSPGHNDLKLAISNNFDLFTHLVCSKFNHFFAKIHSKYAENYSVYSDNIWKLVSILWFSDVDFSSNYPSTYSSSIEYLDVFINWLSVINSSFKKIQTNVQSELYLFNILFELTVGNIDNASSIAVVHSDYQLALSISQGINAPTSKCKVHFQAQLSFWASHWATEYLSPIRIFIYGILSGNFRAISLQPFLDFHLQMNWLQYLLVLMRFIEAPNTPVFRSFICYKNYSINRQLPKPIPLHSDKLLSSRKSSFDIFYTLIAKAHLEDIRPTTLFNISGYTSYLLDYSLSFELLLALYRLEFSDCLLQSHIVINYADQLVILGYWHFAIFILLFLPPSAHKLPAINSIVEKECSREYSLSPNELFVTESLYFENKTLFYYKSCLANYMRNYNLFFNCSIQANEANIAHEILMLKFVFPYIIDDKLHPLKEKLRLIEYQGRTNQIQSWEFEGSIFLDYIRIYETINKLLNGNRCSSSELDDLFQGVRSLCVRISLLNFENYHTRDFLVINEISKNLVLFLKIITTIQKHYHPEDSFSQQTVHYFIKLPLISDNFTGICNEMCDKYLADID